MIRNLMLKKRDNLIVIIYFIAENMMSDFGKKKEKNKHYK